MIETLANWGEFLGGLAVIVSLIYVGIQVRNSAKQTMLSTMQQGTELWTRWTIPVGTSKETAELVLRGMGDFHALSREESYRFTMLMGQYFGLFENMIVQGRGGGLSKENVQSHMDQAYAMFLLHGVQSWWEVWGPRIQCPEMVRYLEERKATGKEVI